MKKRTPICANCKHASAKFRIEARGQNHVHCTLDGQKALRKTEVFEAWDSLRTWYDTCNSHEPKHQRKEGETITHDLKILEDFAWANSRGQKSWELRKFDRDFRVGDFMRFTILREDGTVLVENAYTERITYIFEGGRYGLKKGYCILSIEPISK